MKSGKLSFVIAVIMLSLMVVTLVAAIVVAICDYQRVSIVGAILTCLVFVILLLFITLIAYELFQTRKSEKRLEKLIKNLKDEIQELS